VEEIYGSPRHPYTQALLASKPTLDPRRRTDTPPISGDPPNPINPPLRVADFGRAAALPSKFAPRAWPKLVPLSAKHGVACLMAEPGSGHSQADAT